VLPAISADIREDAAQVAFGTRLAVRPAHYSIDESAAINQELTMSGVDQTARSCTPERCESWARASE
jgi:hypothetical protein